MALLNSYSTIYWNGLAPRPLGYTEIFIPDGKIKEVGKKVAKRNGAEIMDLSRDFVMPGFIDCLQYK